MKEINSMGNLVTMDQLLWQFLDLNGVKYIDQGLIEMYGDKYRINEPYVSYHGAIITRSDLLTLQKGLMADTNIGYVIATLTGDLLLIDDWSIDRVKVCSNKDWDKATDHLSEHDKGLG